jgi:hypothetical protein
VRELAVQFSRAVGGDDEAPAVAAARQPYTSYHVHVVSR